MAYSHGMSLKKKNSSSALICTNKAAHMVGSYATPLTTTNTETFLCFGYDYEYNVYHKQNVF